MLNQSAHQTTSPVAMPAGTTEGDRLLRFSEVELLLGGVSKPTLHRWEKTGVFPRRIIVCGKVRWKLSDIRQFLAKAEAGEAVNDTHGRPRGRHLNTARAAAVAA